MNMAIVSKIKRLKPAQGFTVKTKRERNEAIRDAKSLRQLGVIDFNVTTRAEGEGFKVIAV